MSFTPAIHAVRYRRVLLCFPIIIECLRLLACLYILRGFMYLLLLLSPLCCTIMVKDVLCPARGTGFWRGHAQFLVCAASPIVLRCDYYKQPAYPSPLVVYDWQSQVRIIRIVEGLEVMSVKWRRFTNNTAYTHSCHTRILLVTFRGLFVGNRGRELADGVCFCPFDIRRFRNDFMIYQ